MNHKYVFVRLNIVISLSLSLYMMLSNVNNTFTLIQIKNENYKKKQGGDKNVTKIDRNQQKKKQKLRVPKTYNSCRKSVRRSCGGRELCGGERLPVTQKYIL